MIALSHIALALYATIAPIALVAIVGAVNAHEDGVWGYLNRQVASTPTTLRAGLAQSAVSLAGCALLLLAAAAWPASLAWLWHAERRAQRVSESSKRRAA